MTIGDRIKRLRQERGWSQAQLAQKLNAHQKQISKYERDINVPATKILIRIAKTFNASLDYLVFDEPEGNRDMDIADRELIQKLSEIDKLSKQDKELIKGILDTFIIKNRFQRLASETNITEK